MTSFAPPVYFWVVTFAEIAALSFIASYSMIYFIDRRRKYESA